MRLDIDNWRWSGVPWFIRTGKRLPVTQTELRVVFRHPPRLGFIEHGHRRPEPDQLVVSLDPSTGMHACILDAHRADSPGPQAISSTWSSRRRAARRRRPMRCCCSTRCAATARASPARTAIEETWRIFQPLLDAPPPVHPYAPGSWGPEEGKRLVSGYGHWHGPWVAT